MNDPLVLAFYLWLLASLFVLAKRLTTTGSLRSTPKVSKKAAPTRPSIDDELAAMGAPPATVVNDFDAARSEAPEASETEVNGTVAVADPEIADPAVTAPKVVAHQDGPRARSLVEALDGITMPCDLAPLVIADGFDERRMVFTTRGVPAAEIGTGIADELEALGYALTPADERTLDALRGGTALRVRIYEELAAAQLELGSRVATAREGSIVVEFVLT